MSFGFHSRCASPIGFYFFKDIQIIVNVWLIIRFNNYDSKNSAITVILSLCLLQNAGLGRGTGHFVRL